MQAIILAAGMGKRLKALTRSNTKCMVKVNGVTLIERMLRQIERYRLSRIVIVVGYEGQKLMDFIETLQIQTPLVYISNPDYETTNNIHSLAMAKEWLCREDTLLFESDIIFEDAVLDTLVSDPRDTLAVVDKYEPWMDGTCVRLSPSDGIVSFISGKDFQFSSSKGYFKTVNIYKFSRDFSRNCYVPFLEAYQSAMGENEYYEQVLRVISILGRPVIRALRLEGQRWYEIDDIQDLDIAESLFAVDGSQRLSLLEGRYGGYWRYPKLLDFCYLVNPYFPPQRMLEELKANFDRLLTAYPSGMQVNCILASRSFGVDKENILVGNGAAELIKSLSGLLEGKTGIIRPTFEEYPNRRTPEEMVCFSPDNPDRSYSAEDVMAFFDGKDIQSLVLINPDNPSGNYIPKAGLMRLADWCGARDIRLVLDESFADFAEEEDNSLIRQDILDRNRQLFVVKSISKSYGVPGLRLGILASGDREIVARMKKDVAIWNINSFAEFYMQIAEKYRAGYVDSLKKLKNERNRLISRLEELPGLRTVPSQANFVMAELTGGPSARELAERLLTRHEILIRDLGGKMGGANYIRLAIRSSEDNDRLVQALESELAGR